MTGPIVGDRPLDARPDDASAPLVVATDLARVFGSGPSAVVAVHGASCSLATGDRVALVGPSGSGKSTLLHLLGGLEEPTHGRIEWPGLAPEERARPGAVAVVFQGDSLVPSLDVVENVALPLVLAGTPDAEARRWAVAVLDDLGLGEVAAKLPDELSGGQAQRVAVARALAGRPRLLLADEPTGHLDHGSAAVVVDLLLGVAAHRGCALVVSTHDPAIAARFPRHWTMADGRLETAEVVPCSP